MSAAPSMIDDRIGLLALFALMGCSIAAPRAYAQSTTPIAISNNSESIGFDDLGFSTKLHKVIVPAGRTGKMILIDPVSRRKEEIGGFSSQTEVGGDHGQGVTSADVGRGAIFTADRTEKTLDVVDPTTKSILAKTKLASGPDYVRFVAATNEVWVTEPHRSQIEIFSLPEQGFPEPSHAAIIKIANGPESLVIDDAAGRAYSNLWTDTTLAIDLKRRAIVAQWKNGCLGSRGLALDLPRGFITVGCEEGKLEVMSLKNGRPVGSASSGDGVDIIAYAPTLHHAYLPGARSATMAVIDISPTGRASVLGTVPTATGGHCVTADDLGNAYICDPAKGRLLIYHDSLAAPSQ